MAINTNYASACGVCLGVFHIIFGIASCGSGIAACTHGVYLNHIGIAIWGGALYIFAGILGLVSGSRQNGVITAYYVMSCISVFVSMGQMGVYSYAVYEDLRICDQYSDWTNGYYCPYVTAKLVVSGTACMAGFLEWIMAMSSACASCSCCCASSPPQTGQTVLIHAMQPMAEGAPQQVYVGQPGGSMPPPQIAPQAYLGQQIPDRQDYVIRNVGPGPGPGPGPDAQRGAYLPNMTQPPYVDTKASPFPN